MLCWSPALAYAPYRCNWWTRKCRNKWSLGEERRIRAIVRDRMGKICFRAVSALDGRQQRRGVGAGSIGADQLGHWSLDCICFCVRISLASPPPFCCLFFFIFPDTSPISSVLSYRLITLVYKDIGDIKSQRAGSSSLTTEHFIFRL